MELYTNISYNSPTNTRWQCSPARPDGPVFCGGEPIKISTIAPTVIDSPIRPVLAAIGACVVGLLQLRRQVACADRGQTGRIGESITVGAIVEILIGLPPQKTEPSGPAGKHYQWVFVGGL